MLDRATRRTDPKGRRDLAVLRLLHDLGLRREEVCRLDVEDLDREAGTLAVLGKGKREKVRLTLPAPTRAAIEAWLAVRPPIGVPRLLTNQAAAGPLFTSFDRGRRGSGRLNGQAVYRLVVTLGRAAGVKTWPHALRHLAITSALDVTGGDFRKVQRYSRHADPRTILRYDDNRQDLAGEVARRVAKEAG
jgi:integrase/recombinase XerC